MKKAGFASFWPPANVNVIPKKMRNGKSIHPGVIFCALVTPKKIPF
ncbi:unnamed protein product [Acidithrix sp. C25]|nr:unnamed protein product [Acidithrix sp. C25]